MPFKDPTIAFGPAMSARAFQAVFPLIRRLQYSSPDVQFATKPIAKPQQMTVPTRHGTVRALIYTPTAADVAAQAAAGHRPPAHLITHGGGFIIRVPEQEDNVARYLASEVGCYVVLPDYDTARRSMPSRARAPRGTPSPAASASWASPRLRWRAGPGRGPRASRRSLRMPGTASARPRSVASRPSVLRHGRSRSR